MPTSLSDSLNINLKTLRVLVILLLSPLTFYAQQLTGLWTGSLTNDSNTVRRDQSFEIALTEYRGKVYGYSRMTFFVHDTLYYILKRVKGVIDGDVCEVKDDEIISNNFPRKPEKGVKLISTFRRNKQDSIWFLDGDWKTSEAKRHGYYSISGKISLKQEPDLEMSKILPHLEELNLANDVAFYTESKKTSERTVKSELVIADKKTGPAIDPGQKTTNDIIASSTPATQFVKVTTIPTSIKEETKEADKDKSIPVAVNTNTTKSSEIKTETKEKIATDNNKTEAGSLAVNTKPAIIADKNIKTKEIIIDDYGNEKSATMTVFSKPKEEPKGITSVPEKNKTAQQVANNKQEIVSAKPENRKPEAVNNNQLPEKKEVITPAVQVVTKTVVKKQPASSDSPAALVDERKSEFAQEVLFKSDSLELSLYDNGEIDGDTVSVLLNGEVILAKQGLKASAIKKTIYIPQNNTDSLVLVLYAENLGKYPPNTGLLIVHDGDDVYQVRFSADLQKNAGVIFRKKKN